MEENQNQSQNQAQAKKSYSVGLPTFLLFIALIAIGVMGYFLFNISKEKDNAVSEANNLKSQVDEMKNTVYDMQTQLDSYSKTITSKNSSSVENSTDDETSSDDKNTTDGQNSTGDKNSTTENQSTSSQKEYANIENKLSNNGGLFITDIEENDDKYTLKGVVYSQYTLTKNELNEVIADGKLKLNNTNYTIKKDESDDEIKYLLLNPNSANNDALYEIRKKDSNTYYITALAQISDVWELTGLYKQITIDKNTKVESDYSGTIVSASEEFENFKKKTPEETTNPSPIYNFEFKNGECTKLIRLTSAI